MSTYNFSTITAAQALALTAADTLVVDQGSGSVTTVLFQPGSGGAADQISLAVGATTVAFSAALAAATKTYTDGSTLYIGSSSNDGPVAGGAGNDGLYGGPGSDTLSGGGGNNLLQGNQGADSLTGGTGRDVIYGGQDNDTIMVGASAGGGSNFAQGNRGDDTVSGSSVDADILLGGQGNDVIGAAGIGPATVLENGLSIYLNPVGFTGGGSDTLDGNLGNDSIFAGTGDDTVLGEDGDDYIYDQGGRNTINGGAGNDLIAGSGTIDAGAGNDIVGFLGTGTVVISLGDGDDLCGTLDDSAASATIDGGAGNDNIFGSDGADSLAGGAGNDVLDGGAGSDVMNGGAGADLFEVSAGLGGPASGTGPDLVVVGDGMGGLVHRRLDAILDWDGTQDKIYFGSNADSSVVVGGGATASNYTEISAADYASARTAASAQIHAGVFEYVAVQVGSDVVVFGDANQNHSEATVGVALVGRTLADIAFTNFGAVEL